MRRRLANAGVGLPAKKKGESSGEDVSSGDEEESRDGTGSETEESHVTGEEEKEGRDEGDDAKKKMFQALQQRDFESMIDVIEADEVRRCAAKRMRPPKGIRKKNQVSPLVNYEDVYGQTPMLVACKMGIQRVVVGLLLRGANANYENKLGKTPLAVACEFGNSKAVAALVEKRDYGLEAACVKYKNKDGKTCEDFIIPKARAKILPILEKASLSQKIKFVRKVQKAERKAFEFRREARELGLTPDELRKALGDAASSESDVSDVSDHFSDEDEIQPRKQTGIRNRATTIIKDIVYDGKGQLKRSTYGMKRKTAVQRVTNVVLYATGAQRAGREAAAEVIQKAARIYLARRRFQRAVRAKLDQERYKRKLIKYSTKIQQVFRASRARRLVKELLFKSKMATKIQALFRGYVERRDRAVFIENQRLGEAIWLGKMKRRGWMGRFAKRARDAAWEKAARKAALVMTTHVRGALARRNFAKMRRERKAAVAIQRFARGHQARHPGRNRLRRFNYESKQRRRQLITHLESLGRLLHVLHLKSELAAASKIMKIARPFAKQAAAKAAAETNDGAAIEIQRAFRGMQARRVAKLMKAKAIERQGLLGDCMTIRSLVPSQKHHVLGSAAMYGYCGKCDCRCFAECLVGGKMQDVICECGHHRVNHALGAFRSLHKDFFGQTKIKPLGHKFHSSVGEMNAMQVEQARMQLVAAQEAETKRAEKAGLADQELKLGSSIYAQQKRKQQIEAKAARKAKEKRQHVIDRIDGEWKQDELRMAQKRAMLKELHRVQEEERHIAGLLALEEDVNERLERQKERLRRMHRDEIANRRKHLRQRLRRPKVHVSSPCKSPKSPSTIAPFQVEAERSEQCQERGNEQLVVPEYIAEEEEEEEGKYDDQQQPFQICEWGPHVDIEGSENYWQVNGYEEQSAFVPVDMPEANEGQVNGQWELEQFSPNNQVHLENDIECTDHGVGVKANSYLDESNDFSDARQGLTEDPSSHEESYDTCCVAADIEDEQHEHVHEQHEEQGMAPPVSQNIAQEFEHVEQQIGCWQQFRDPPTNSYYYYNVETKETTWVAPPEFVQPPIACANCPRVQQTQPDLQLTNANTLVKAATETPKQTACVEIQTDFVEQEILEQITAIDAKSLYAYFQTPAQEKKRLEKTFLGSPKSPPSLCVSPKKDGLKSPPREKRVTYRMFLELVADQPVEGLPERISLHKTPLVLGRAKTTDVCLDAATHPRMVSKQHCVIHSDCRKGLVEVLDLSSTNGTRINGTKVHSAGNNSEANRRSISQGDVVTLGTKKSPVRYRLRVQTLSIY